MKLFCQDCKKNVTVSHVEARGHNKFAVILAGCICPDEAVAKVPVNVSGAGKVKPVVNPGEIARKEAAAKATKAPPVEQKA